MKRYVILTIAVVLGMLSANAQYQMKVTLKNGQETQFNVSDIENITWQEEKEMQMSFVGYANEYSTRAVMDTNGQVMFQNGDAISVFDGANNKRFSTTDEGTSAIFTGTAATTDNYAILYPYQENAEYADGYITATIPNLQFATESSFDPAANVNVATATADGSFHLKNVCGFIRFNTTQDCGYVDLRGDNVAGVVSINPKTGEYTIVEGFGRIILLEVKANKDYYIAVLPGVVDFVMGFCATDYGADYGADYIEKSIADVTLKRSTVLDIGQITFPTYDPTDGSDSEWVDLGLSVKWATRNIGADSPEDYGGYYAWGETEEKEVYDWSTYKWGSEPTKYVSCDELEPEDDVAHVKWGGNWRMPTMNEMLELSNEENCTWIHTKRNGVEGYRVISKKNGNSIFLPFAGIRNEYHVDAPAPGTATYGGYWSNSVDIILDSEAVCLHIDPDDVRGASWLDRTPRQGGRSVRAVCP